MKILLVNALYEPHILGGAEIHVQALARWLAKDHQVFVLTTRPYQGLESLKLIQSGKDGIRIYRFYPFFYPAFLPRFSDLSRPLRLWQRLIDLWNPHAYLVTQKLLSEIQPDVIHTHNVLGLSTSVFSAIKRAGVPHVHTIHDYQLLSPWALLFRNGKVIDLEKLTWPERGYQAARRRLSGSIGGLIAPSKFALELHEQAGFFAKTTRKVIAPGFEIEPVGRRNGEDNQINILYMGQLTEHKGMGVLVKAFRETQGQKLRLHFAGRGRQETLVKDFAAAEPRVTYHGFVGGKRKRDLWAQTDVLVLPSIWYENMPVVALESLSYGVPVIASRIGGIPEVISEKNGWLFEPGDKDELMEILVRLDRKEIKVKSRRLQEMKEWFSIKSIGPQIVELYQSLLEN
jgi:glycosyltransferase involved in cell wall biosynthesis